MSALAADDYLSFCDGVRRLTGIDLTQYKRPQMERRLRTFFERQGAGRLTDCLPRLREDRSELEALIDRLTINVSQLWRNPDQWQRLADRVLPQLAAGGRIVAWSAGCSYGAEAYTLAALIRERHPGVRLELLGTDIDRRMVERAREPVFSAQDARRAPADAVGRHFERTADGWRPRPELMRGLRFEVGDLLRIVPQPERFDLIVCRNTVIYFSDPIRDALHARLAGALRPGGYLMIGATERVTDPSALGLSPVHPFLLVKR